MDDPTDGVQRTASGFTLGLAVSSSTAGTRTGMRLDLRSRVPWGLPLVIAMLVAVVGIFGFGGPVPASAQSPPPSSDAALARLVLTGDGYYHSIDNPNTGVDSYSGTVSNHVSSLDVNPYLNHPGASYVIKINGVTDPDGTVSLVVGRNVITVEDTTTKNVYTVAISRSAILSTDATLSGLSLSEVDFGTFSSETLSYSADVSNKLKETTVVATVNDPGASYVIELGGVEVTGGLAPLSVGSNVIAVEVTAEDGQTTQTYTVTVNRAANTPATGAPRIEGAAQLGEELSACTFACIDDADGMTNASIRHQWIRRDGTTETDIAGATGSLYIIIDADVGKTLKVRASFTDDAGGPESLTSAATKTVSGIRNSPTTGAPIIVGTARVGETLTVDTSGIADADGLTKASYSGVLNAGNYFRVYVDLDENFSYRVSRGDLGLPLKVTLNFADDAGNRVTLDSAPTASVAPTSPAALELFTVSKDAFGDPELAWANPFWDFAGELDGRSTWGDGGSPITGYVVQWKETGDSWDAAADVSEAIVNIRRHTIWDLPGGKEYSIRVLAVNAVGRGIPTSEAIISIDRSNQPSSDATLSALTLSGVNFGVFAPGTASYTAQVDNGVSRTLVVPTVSHLRASYAIKLGGVVDADGVINLSVGRNVIAIEVTAEDGKTTQTYIITVTRTAVAGAPVPLTDATLRRLALSGIDIGGGVGEGADVQTRTSFTASVYHSISQTTVSPALNHSGASYIIKLGGLVDADGTIPLAVGNNVITVEVTAEDNSTTKTYTATVNRATAAAPTTGELSTDDPAVNFRVIDFFSDHTIIALNFPRNRGITGWVLQRYEHDGDSFVSSGSDWHSEYSSSGDIGGEEEKIADTEVEPDALYKWVAMLTNSQGSTVIETSLTVRIPPDETTELSSDASLSALTLSEVDFGHSRRRRLPTQRR